MHKRSFIIIFIISLVLGWQLLLPGYYSMHDDLQVMRQFQMNRCFENGQIPCRWSPDLANNYGQPHFNFYSAFPYYLGQVFHQLGFSYIDTIKLLFFVSLLFSGIFIYLLAAQFVGTTASLIAAVAYMAAPYHAVDIFVRGALSESFGLTLIPAVLLTLILVGKRPSVYTSAALSLTLFALLTTHHITTLVTAPILVITSIIALIISREKRKCLKHLVIGGILGVGLSSFFLLPVIFERALIDQTFLTSDYFDFRAHYVSLSQLFTKLSFGYGPSRFNSVDYPETLSFFVGLVPIASLLFTPLFIWANRKNRSRLIPIVLLFGLSLVYLFMTHARSVLIWEAFPTLAFVQFPWRLLGPVTFLIALLIAFISQTIIERGKKASYFIAFVTAFLISSNFAYFRFEKYFPDMTDAVKLSGSEYDYQIRGAILDYLPKGVKVPEEKAPNGPEIIEGNVDINYFDKRSNFFGSEFDVLSETATVRFPVMYFAGWTVYQDRKPTPITISTDNDFGQIEVTFEKGHRVIQAFFEDTPIRRAANLITLTSAFILIFWLVKNESKDEK